MKKILSIILVGMMLISLVPCAFAADGELEVKYNFDFGAAGYGSTAEIGIDTLKTYGDLSTESQDSKDAHTWAGNAKDGLWLVDGHKYATGLALTGADVGDSTTKKPDSLYFSMYGTRVFNGGELTTNGALVLRLQINEAGTYIPKLTYYPRKDLAQYDVYLVSLKTENFYLQASDRNRLTFGNNQITVSVYTAIKKYSNTYLGKVEMYSTDDTAKTVELNPYTVSEAEAKYGQFALFFYPNGINEDAGLHSNGTQALTQYINLDSFKLLGEKKAEINLDSEFAYKEEAYTGGGTTLRAFAVYGTDGEVSETEIIETPAVTYGSTCTVSAAETVTKGDKTYDFLCWAKGATMEKKQIISHSAEFSYKPHEGANYLIALYEEANSDDGENKYYNANGERLEDGDTLPSMAGFGTATGWKTTGNGVYVAEYDAPSKNIEITVDGSKTSYAYGDKVTCNANAPEGKVFMYWTKDGAVITTSPTYTFNAWESCTVTAVYGDAAPTLGKEMRKIILSSFNVGNEPAVMAEFIGFEDALEKGIMFGTKRVAMTSDKTQFSVIDDIDGEICGYAIVNDGGELKIVTDGDLSEQ